MAFQQGLSGLNAASKNLEVIGNNVANVNTTGMKSSRAEFSEIYASSISSAGGVSQGLGVRVANVAQNFTQGNLTATGNDLDVAINGGGFFILRDNNGENIFSRAGMFKLNRDGEIVNNDGAQLMGYPTDAAGNRLSVTPGPLEFPSGGVIPAQRTSSIEAEINLDARAQVAALATPPTPLSTYGTALVAYDDQGIPVPVSFAFEKTANNTWNVYTGVNGSDPALSTPFQISFLPNGQFDPASAVPTLTLASPNDPTATFNVNLDMSKLTQFGTSYAVTKLEQDGYQPGVLTSLNIDETGVITGSYSNGEKRAAGQIALANFRNSQGLEPISGSAWRQTFASGDALMGQPGNGNLGMLRSGALEDSNVDVTAELVSMMTAQRTYQANAQSIKTQDQVLSTLLNMR